MASMSGPGLQVEGGNALPGSIVPVPTAIPAFIGYTPRADDQGVSYLDTPVMIGSMAEFAACFLLAEPAQQSRPNYLLVPSTSTSASTNQTPTGDTLDIGGETYDVLPDPGTLYHLYNSVRLFFLNGGTQACIVSVGGYGPPSGAPQVVGTPLVNPNVKLADLLRGLEILKREQAPTLYLCPEATLLSQDDNATLMQAMLEQASTLGTVMCLFDVINGDQPDATGYTQDIEAFRSGTGETGLDHGACYYPFVDTTVMQPDELDFTNLFGGDTTQLAPLLDPPGNPNPAAAQVLATIQHPPVPAPGNAQLQAQLLAASPTYVQIMQQVLSLANRLPPSGAMAGVYATVDANSGVWVSPANVAIVGATDVTIRLTDAEQGPLNIDAVSGKSINALRTFANGGVLVWGARTLDGNSDDWRYIAVRRTVIYIEQSIKQALQAFVFQPNDKTTWVAVNAMVSSFLTGLWSQGGLQGARPSDAFSVEVGLGTSMTAQDILEGNLRVVAKVALVHPAEFQVIEVTQELATSD